MAAFPQLFTLARTHLDLSGGNAARRGTPALRSVWSLAWAIGPLAGAAVLSWRGYDALMVLTAAAFALVALPLAVLGPTPAPVRVTAPESGRARDVALAVVGALGITYVQDLLPHATGRATTMYANTLTIGSLISGVLAGATAQALGYRSALLLCGALAAAGCVLFAAARVSGRDAARPAGTTRPRDGSGVPDPAAPPAPRAR